MTRALRVEYLKMRRSPVVVTTTLLIIVLVPLLAFVFAVAAGAEGSSTIVLKAQALVHGEGWVAYLDLLGQMMAITLFIGPGVVVAWVFGREHSDRVFPSLFALPVGRGSIAMAKFVVSLAWGVALVAAVLAISVAVGLAVDVGPIGDVDLADAVVRLVAVGVLTVVLATTVALPASVGRGYLPAIGAIILVTFAAQMAVVVGSGGWFPYAAPGLYAVGGVDESIRVGVLELLLVPILAGVVWWWTIRWWRTAEVT